MKKIILLVIISCLSVTVLFAQTSTERTFQISFLSPIGTNGLQSHLTTNKVSLNLLGGYSYGNTSFELGSLYNINLHLTRGCLLAGIANYSGYAENATQIAGVGNIAPKGTVAVQIGGVFNSAKQVKGAQIAGMTNYSRHAENGTQVAGVANIASQGAVAAQISGVLNSAKQVKGVQIGLINYADTCDGVAIGLINIVKKGGKHEFEVSLSEALNTSVSFKLGTNKLYTIFSAGINYLDNPVQYAYGFGLGTHLDWKKNWGNQIEVMGYQITEDGKFEDGVNILTQLRLTVSKQITNHFKVFAGPVLNMTISDYEHPETGELGSTLAPWSMWKNKIGNTHLNSWIGFSAGVRF